MQPPGSTYAADCFRKAWRPFDETFIGLDRTTFTNERVDNVFDVTNGTQDLPACDVLVLIAGWSGREATRGLSIHVGWHWLLATSAAQPPEGAYPDSMPLAASRHRFRATCATPRHNESGHAAAGHNGSNEENEEETQRRRVWQAGYEAGFRDAATSAAAAADKAAAAVGQADLADQSNHEEGLSTFK